MVGTSPLTRLIIEDAHVKNLHAGTSQVLSYLRQKFWLPKARQRVKNSLKKCVSCKKVEGRPLAPPPYPPLPADRVSFDRPFKICGVDYTGAIPIKDGEQIKKGYIVLFTCTNSRAIHLEVVYDLSAESFLNAFIKFSSRRSFPEVMYSDNATNFVAAADFLKYISQTNLLTNFMLNNRIEWKFITPRAPWHGGMYERMIGITKNAFKKVIGKALITKIHLETIVPQIEARINDRPITYITDDIKDFDPLTPSQLLLGYKLREFPNIIEEQQIADPSYHTREYITKSFQLKLRNLSQIWARWKQEYLTSLRERYNTKYCPSFVELGSIVLISDQNPRTSWKLGKITKLFPSSDHHIRSVELKTENGFLVRPISKLFPLEIVARPVETQDVQNRVVPRVRRTAAVEALRHIRDMAE